MTGWYATFTIKTVADPTFDPENTVSAWIQFNADLQSKIPIHFTMHGTDRPLHQVVGVYSKFDDPEAAHHELESTVRSCLGAARITFTEFHLSSFAKSHLRGS
jgi:hypothetical protein